MLLVKICGITHQEDVLILLKYPVWALGFIQVEKSPRYVNPETAKKLISMLPTRIQSVGVLQDHSFQEVEKIRDYCGFSMVQLHGREDPGFCTRLEKGVIRAFRLGKEWDFNQMRDYQSVVDYFLFDTFVPGKSEGTGQTFPWELLRGTEHIACPFLIDGGLSPDNISNLSQHHHSFWD